MGSYWKKILKKGQMSWNWCHLSGEHEFWAKFGSRAKIDRGGFRSPPPKPGKASQTSNWLNMPIVFQSNLNIFFNLEYCFDVIFKANCLLILMKFSTLYILLFHNLRLFFCGAISTPYDYSILYGYLIDQSTLTQHKTC